MTGTEIYKDFNEKRLQWITNDRRRTDIRGEKKLAYAVVRQWIKDVEKSIENLSFFADSTLPVKDILVRELAEDLTWPLTESARFWTSFINIHHTWLKKWALLKLEAFLKERPEFLPDFRKALSALSG